MAPLLIFVVFCFAMSVNPQKTERFMGELGALILKCIKFFLISFMLICCLFMWALAISGKETYTVAFEATVVYISMIWLVPLAFKLFFWTVSKLMYIDEKIVKN